MTENQIKSIPFKLECSSCKKIFSYQDFVTSIIQYGLILLDGSENCWFGCTCPFCTDHSTLIQKFSKQDLPQELINIYNSIVNDQEWYWNYSSPIQKDQPTSSQKYFLYQKWIYNSFPYNFEHLSVPFFHSFQEISSGQNKIFDFHGPEYIYCEENIEQAEAQEIIKKSYCSYLRGSRVLEPGIKMLWFADDEINDLAKLESTDKKKVFPRYTLYDATWANIQAFCWSNKFQLDFAKEISKETEIPLVDFLSISSKKRLVKAYGFLDILDQNPSFQKGATEINVAQEAIEPLVPISKKSIYFNKATRERLTKKIWDNFRKDYIQDTLIFNADKFIEKFYELSQSISFSYGSVWSLKEKCLIELHEIINSKYQRKKKAKERANDIQEKAKEAEKSFPDVKIISNDRSINELKIYISKLHKAVKVLNFKGPILLLGEPGTGKTHFAKAIHQALKCKGDFIKVDCGVKSEQLFESELFGHKKGAFTGASENRKGAFELAAGGVIFLDEIGNISKNLQQKFLSVLQDRQYEAVGSSESKKTDAFIIAATNENLEELIGKDKFRVDLFDRLDKENITIPPLRERKKDVPLFFQKFIKSVKIDPVLENKLKSLDYDWPGNVRELVQTIERIERHKIMYDDPSAITFEDLPEKIKNSEKLKSSKKENALSGNTKVTEYEVRKALAKNNGNKTHAAKELNVTTQTIRRWCKKLGL